MSPTRQPMLTPTDARVLIAYGAGMLTHSFTVAVSGHSDQTYAVGILHRKYDRGRQVSSDLIRNNWTHRDGLNDMVADAVSEIVRLTEAQDAADATSSPPTISGAPRPPGGATGGF